MTLHYPFPIIRHLDDVLPHIQGRAEFIRVDKEGYTVLNYVFQTSETFPDVTNDAAAILRECRGMIFDTTSGRIVNRRLHKFFNLGERSDTTDIDVSRPHHVLDKLDGSMISPLMVGGGIRWASKMGVTHVSMQAEAFVAAHPEYERFAFNCLGADTTPIFEWMSRGNRIVLDYGDDKLTLLALRDNVSGQYTPRDNLEALAMDYGLPLVGAVSTSLGSMGQFVENLRLREGIEGVVITFDDGHMVKIKTDWYVQLHRAKDQISRERHLIALILGDKIDDLLPALPEDDRARVMEFAATINFDLTEFSCLIMKTMTDVRKSGWDRKAFALSGDLYGHAVRSCCFHMFDVSQNDIASQAHQWGRNFVARNLGSSGALEKARSVLSTASWEEKATE